ncbi:uncharacterized protein LOC133176874 [Saccostrea echinata]|uniref:uncharacterized protein LOC133176874 n=1 Tax=Saccostrea echinata TaxID=191078 RepID=UPI002A82F3E3|nr:uncharacterized protein LOC133176874 [Saccostrea echinata]
MAGRSPRFTQGQTTSSLTNIFTFTKSSELTTNTSPTISSKTTLFILLPASVAVMVFFVIIFVCWLFCRRRKEALTETYNHYSHVDQTEFVDFHQGSEQILTANQIEYEMVIYPASDVANSDNIDSGFSQTDDRNGNLFSMDKSTKERVLLNGPQFSEPKGSPSLKNDDDLYLKTSPLEVQHNFEVSPQQNGNDDNYFMLEPMNLNFEKKTNGQVDGQTYFTIEPSQK